MKVIHVESGMHLYGGALQVLFLLRGLRDSGEHVLVCPPGSKIGEAAAEHVRVVTLPIGGDLDFAFIRRFRRLLRAEKPDLVHLHSRRGADILGGLAARLEGVPAVLSRRVDNPEPRWAVRLKYRLYQRVITISRGIAAVLMRQGVDPEKIRCVHSAVDTELYRPGGDPRWLRETFSLPADARVVGMAAQLIERKGHRVLLEAAPAVLAQHPRARFLLFGQGPLREALAAEIEQRGLQHAVMLAGFRTDMARILPSLDLLVHPAYMEGLGVALLQTAACGVPIVACRAGGIPEIVRDGENGRLVEPGDAPALASAVSAVLGDPALAARYGAEGRRIACADFSIEAMVAGNQAVYQEVVRGSSTEN
jgi:glycosyltransferase involved in cell wall biosynthesis